MDIYSQIALKIIKGQEAIIGPVAVEQARHVDNMQIDWEKQEVKVSGNGVKALEDLIEKYRELFGQISVEVSKQSASSLLSKLPAGKELPVALR